jgi:uncharacterized protein YjlB
MEMIVKRKRPKGIVEAYKIDKYYLKDDGVYPNSRLPVLHYKQVLKLPHFFASSYIRNLFKVNHWSNSWKAGIFEYHHYHSNAHEVLGVYEGKAKLLLGGEHGVELIIERGDVLIIPAGVAHKNLSPENDVKCVGAYAEGKNYDIKYGKPGDRPHADRNIRNVNSPSRDPVFGLENNLSTSWR